MRGHQDRLYTCSVLIGPEPKPAGGVFIFGVPPPPCSGGRRGDAICMTHTHRLGPEEIRKVADVCNSLGGRKLGEYAARHTTTRGMCSAAYSSSSPHSRLGHTLTPSYWSKPKVAGWVYIYGVPPAGAHCSSEKFAVEYDGCCAAVMWVSPWV